MLFLLSLPVSLLSFCISLSSFVPFVAVLSVCSPVFRVFLDVVHLTKVKQQLFNSLSSKVESFVGVKLPKKGKCLGSALNTFHWFTNTDGLSWLFWITSKCFILSVLAPTESVLPRFFFFIKPSLLIRRWNVAYREENKTKRKGNT